MVQTAHTRFLATNLGEHIEVTAKQDTMEMFWLILASGVHCVHGHDDFVSWIQSHAGKLSNAADRGHTGLSAANAKRQHWTKFHS